MIFKLDGKLEIPEIRDFVISLEIYLPLDLENIQMFINLFESNAIFSKPEFIQELNLFFSSKNEHYLIRRNGEIRLKNGFYWKTPDFDSNLKDILELISLVIKYYFSQGQGMENSGVFSMESSYSPKNSFNCRPSEGHSRNLSALAKMSSHQSTSSSIGPISSSIKSSIQNSVPTSSKDYQVGGQKTCQNNNNNLQSQAFISARFHQTMPQNNLKLKTDNRNGNLNTIVQIKNDKKPRRSEKNSVKNNKRNFFVNDLKKNQMMKKDETNRNEQENDLKIESDNFEFEHNADTHLTDISENAGTLRKKRERTITITEKNSKQITGILLSSTSGISSKIYSDNNTANLADRNNLHYSGSENSSKIGRNGSTSSRSKKVHYMMDQINDGVSEIEFLTNQNKELQMENDRLKKKLFKQNLLSDSTV